MKRGATIINNASINAYVGRPDLLDYTSTKGAIVAFTRGLSNQYVGRGIRVNAVAPGPVWTPLIPATMNDEPAMTAARLAVKLSTPTAVLLSTVKWVIASAGLLA
jgi:NAD(P)-dependent dehydrogenase (short-subunit alcohol dehydrogenase family)